MELGSICPYTQECITFIMTGCDGVHHKDCEHKPVISKEPNFFEGKTVLVTGGTGSFGTALCEYLKQWPPKKLIVFSSTEEKQEKSKELFKDVPYMRWLLGNVRDYDRLYRAFEGVDIVVHAAAMKRIDICGGEPGETYKTNVFGTMNVVDASINRGVKRTLLISTDKAVNPINTYGVSKAAAERYVLDANIYRGSKDIRFSVVRYGNVIGSNGSIVPKWKKLIEEGATELPITDERMTRFWYKMSDSVQFVTDALKKMKGGEVFIPKIPSIRITDLAAAFRLPYKVVGIRPGEKLHEELDQGYSSDNNEFMTVEQIRETINMA